MDIDERLAREAGVTMDSIPARQLKGQAQWRRLDCPFCGHKRAVINFEANWFECFACERRLSGYSDDPDDLAVNRFAEVIEIAASRVIKDFGEWLSGERDDALAWARYYIVNYSIGKEGDPFDAGRLAQWTAEYNGAEEPWRLDAMVQKVLVQDLTNWAEKLKRWKEANRVTAVDPGNANPAKPEEFGPDRRALNKRVNDSVRQGTRPPYFGSAEPAGTDLSLSRKRYPVCRAIADGYTLAEIAEHNKVSVSTVQRWAEAERDRARSLRNASQEDFLDSL
jgi:hypothetical protein